MSVIINASTSSGLIQTADTSGTLVLQSNGTTMQTIDSTGSYGQLKFGTAVTTNSGTAIDITGIPSWAKRVTVLFQSIICSSTSNLLFQVGAGSVTTSGYSTINSYQSNTGTPFVSSTVTNGFQFMKNIAADNLTGSLVLTNITGNTWLGSGLAWKFGTNYYETSGGTIALGGSLDRVRLTTTSTDTFSSGTINIMYEG